MYFFDINYVCYSKEMINDLKRLTWPSIIRRRKKKGLRNNRFSLCFLSGSVTSGGHSGAPVKPGSACYMAAGGQGSSVQVNGHRWQQYTDIEHHPLFHLPGRAESDAV